MDTAPADATYTHVYLHGYGAHRLPMVGTHRPRFDGGEGMDVKARAELHRDHASARDSDCEDQLDW